MLRVTLKGNNDKLERKLERAFSFFRDNQTLDNWERIVNWLEGLIMGFRASKNTVAIARVEEEIQNYKAAYATAREMYHKEENRISTTSEMQPYSYPSRLRLVQNLFQRNKKWLDKGYYHKELNDFMDNLLETFESTNTTTLLIKVELLALRAKAVSIPNTHKFFF